MRLLLVGIILGLGTLALPQSNTVTTRDQLKGINATFGTTYSLKNNFNFSIIRAYYQLEPLDTYNILITDAESKLLVIEFAVKNVLATDNYFGPDGLFTAVDSKQLQFPDASFMLKSQGNKVNTFTLKPGQGLGQKGLEDPLYAVIKIPAASRINKIIVNQGRAGKADEEVLRFVLSVPPKVQGGPGNYVFGLPYGTVDPKDQWASSLLPESRTTQGAYVPSGYFALRLDDITLPESEVFDGNAPEEGRKYVVATVSAKNYLERELDIFELIGGEKNYELTDTDGERYSPIGYRKRKSDEAPAFKFRKDEEYGYRVFFSVPKAAKPRSITMAGNYGTRWKVIVP